MRCSKVLGKVSQNILKQVIFSQKEEKKQIQTTFKLLTTVKQL
jgi:hypothetical protein